MASNLPDYLAAAQPVPQDNRAPWYKSIAQTYAGVMLWFVFWQGLATAGGHPGGTLGRRPGGRPAGNPHRRDHLPLLFYLVPGLLGMKTGLPLYVVGTSTYGATGGLIMPGLLMGLLAVRLAGGERLRRGHALVQVLWDRGVQEGAVVVPIVHPSHAAIVVVFAAAAAFMGLKGIQYVARVATFFPLIPLVVLVVLTVDDDRRRGQLHARARSPGPVPPGTPLRRRADS